MDQHLGPKNPVPVNGCSKFKQFFVPWLSISFKSVHSILICHTDPRIHRQI